ncbi:MAG: VWA domain-containing protein [Candidatus Mcinerneyibacterium aminivorans]|uniref:VWA domain-containing protein n=1 Tax=Candidatus Mcinerneyibacterium aminivorans TaxID=2703815 RepID=A0A5D0ML55_9BACT|nr:MAG: VWA domain-containing protein [Candidatus Mcinerneyibacterium aminivorans]
MRFLYPLLGILFIPVIIIYYKKFKNTEKDFFIRFPNVDDIEVKKSFFSYGKFYVIEIIIFVLLIFAVMRPQLGKKEIEQKIRGYSIMLVMDISSSMKAADLEPSRFEVAKKVLRDFVGKRQNDFIGFTAFAKSSLTLVPATINREMVLSTIKNLDIGYIEDGTAIGMGISSAVSSLKNSRSKTKIIILLTDGDNNSGNISPSKAADIADEYGIKIYAIGVGKDDRVPYPVETPFGTQYKKVNMKFNEEILKEISRKTGGKYYRATNNKELKNIYGDINRLEKSEFRMKYHIKYEDKFYIPLIAAFIVLSAYYLIRRLIFVME